LDESVALWERGEALARRCEEQLAGARDRVKAVLEHADDPRPEERGPAG
jgi:exodeoxyribonuclease VII small subunit